MEECKIKSTCDELNQFLTTLTQQSIPLPEVLLSSSDTSTIHSRSTEAYRCKCSFQVITDKDDNLECVVRENGEICHLPQGIFPPANLRIREAMNCLMNVLNKRSTAVDSNTRAGHTYIRLRENITSVTFDSSWNEAECLLTLHYGPPGISKSCFEQWKQEAKILCDECDFVRVTGRSKGIKLFVSRSNIAAAADDDSLQEEGIIQDILWLTLQKSSDDEKSIPRVESVSLKQPEQSADRVNVQILYQKPATAFQHPNAGVMLTSLHWILNTLSKVAERHTENKKLRLLEMYNGAGAHTIPLAKSMLFTDIVAVELDERLVSACKNNCRLNNCLKGDEVSDKNETLVEVFKGDAAEWAAKTLRRISKKESNGANDYNEFDILLVDPPRQGLDETVCEMAIKGTFSHLIYISCGRRALVRDLTLLCKSFDIEDLAIIDLFPGTDAVETLIHLKRKVD